MQRRSELDELTFLFCIELYIWQHNRGRKFLHEHPWQATSCKEPAMLTLLSYEGVEARRGDQCPFDRKIIDKDGEALELKPIG